jgi:hypothetical protein
MSLDPPKETGLKKSSPRLIAESTPDLHLPRKKSAEKGVTGRLPIPDFSEKIKKLASSDETQNTSDRKSLSQRTHSVHTSHKIEKPEIKSPRKTRSSSHHLEKRDKITKFTVNVPLMTLVELIDICHPVICHEEWTQKVLKSLLEIFSKPTSLINRLDVILNEVHDGLLKHSSILDRVQKAKKSLGQVDDYGFLKDFLNESNPILFHKKYTQISDSFACEFLYNVFGGVQAIKIIKSSACPNNEGIKQELKSQFDVLSSIERKKTALLDSSFVFQKGFDVEHLDIVPIPISLLKYEEFSDSFRAYYSNGPFLPGGIRINGENFTIPNYNELGVKEEEREVYFQKLLISKLQEKLEIKAVLSEEEQIKIFSEVLPQKFRDEEKNIRQLVVKYLSEPFNDASSLLKRLQAKKIAKDFAEELLPHSEFINKYLIAHKAFKAKEWNELAGDFVSLYYRFYNLQKKKESIPTLALLKAMCFSGYSTGEFFLRKTLCPELFSALSNAPCMKLNRDFIIAFDITGHQSSFEVKQVRSFKIMLGEGAQATLSIPWTVKGNLGSREYESVLEIPEFAFSPNCSTEVRFSLIHHFHLDCSDSPWGSYVKRVEKQVSHQNSFL